VAACRRTRGDGKKSRPVSAILITALGGTGNGRFHVRASGGGEPALEPFDCWAESVNINFKRSDTVGMSKMSYR
jgi:hypothetical protein